MKLSLKPKDARVIHGHEAWWYDNPSSIQILIQPNPGAEVVSCVIKRSELLKYIKRSTPNPR